MTRANIQATQDREPVWKLAWVKSFVTEDGTLQVVAEWRSGGNRKVTKWDL